jgi:hypothetical protein
MLTSEKNTCGEALVYTTSNSVFMYKFQSVACPPLRFISFIVSIIQHKQIDLRCTLPRFLRVLPFPFSHSPRATRASSRELLSVLPDRALYLPTFSHLFIVIKLLSLLIVNKLLSLSLSLSRSLARSLCSGE